MMDENATSIPVAGIMSQPVPDTTDILQKKA
jgi:hypothetical protein